MFATLLGFKEFVLTAPFWGGVGWIVGCFTPGVLRKVKAWFVGEEQKIVKKF